MEQLLLFKHQRLQVPTLAYQSETELASPFQEEERPLLLVLGMEDIAGQLIWSNQLISCNQLVTIVLLLDMFTPHIGLLKFTLLLVLTTTLITTTNIMICKVCNNSIEPERLEILPTTACCISCAHQYNFVKPRRGIMVYDGKTGGELQTMSHDAFENKKHYFTSISSSGFLKTE